MAKGKKQITMKQDMENKITIIKDFAKKMGYSTNEYDYKCYSYNPKDNGRPAHIIELNEVYDGEGNPYSWAWFTDNYTMMG